jgi:hypothetical protein
MICASEEAFMTAFEDCTLGNEGFHHADHVRMAFLYLSRYPVLQAIERFSVALARFAAAKGKPELYNETVTWAFLLLIRERIARAEYPPTWEQFVQQNPDLLTWKENILKTYYRDETLSSELAKKVFLFPDKINLHAE